ncbi:MAG: sodium-dependent transporter [Methanolinea sp.]|jgi:NSS family neurotransmitter:Na+ symporter|nr:sodium-dependent transporter [Methanolinea sp.]
MTGKKEHWSSRGGFILAAIGSAVGIGNIWRFSSVVGQNGGGAYLIPYLIAVFACAFPLMVFELAMGRSFQGTVVSAFRAIRPSFRIAGWFLCATIFLVLCYYLVITGWTAAYALFSLTGARMTFADFTASSLPVIFFLFSAAVTIGVISRGVQKGIERVSVILIPVSVAILVVMALSAATLPGFLEGTTFLFSPDFSVLFDPFVWSAAFGQAFFSLSVGTGILLTYGAYMEKGISIPRSALVITLADLGVALLAGIVIFPLVFTFGLEPAAGAELAFSTLPKAFALMPGGAFFAVAFFLVLFFAAITSAVSMLEVGVSSLREAVAWSREKTSLLLGLVMVAVGLPSALSYSAANWTIGSVRVLDFMDETVGTLGLPLAAVILAVSFSWFAPREVLDREIGRSFARIVHPLCKYVIPAVLLVTTLARLASGIDLADLRLLPGSPWMGTLMQVGGMVLIGAGTLIVVSLLCRFGRCPFGQRLFRKG